MTHFRRRSLHTSSTTYNF